MVLGGSMPFFTVIVVSYNAEDTIKETLTSILSQTFNDYEIIIKDAISRDHTLELIPHDSRIKVYSCKDTGIYDGMNQAIDYATGKYICFMNCGDSFYDNNVLAKIYQLAKDAKEKTIIYGNYYTKGETCSITKSINKSFLYRHPICHQTMFWSNRLFDELGKYDITLKIVSDYDYTLKCFCSNTCFIHSGITVCSYLGDGVSATKKNKKRLHDENKIVRSRYYSKSEILKYDIKLALTMPRLRSYLNSDRSPKLLKRLYIKIANKINH